MYKKCIFTFIKIAGVCESELSGQSVTSDKMSEYQHLCEMFMAAASLGPCILILDGIDEISGSYGLTPQQVSRSITAASISFI